MLLLAEIQWDQWGFGIAGIAIVTTGFVKLGKFVVSQFLVPVKDAAVDALKDVSETQKDIQQDITRGAAENGEQHQALLEAILRDREAEDLRGKHGFRGGG